MIRISTDKRNSLSKNKVDALNETFTGNNKKRIIKFEVILFVNYEGLDHRAIRAPSFSTLTS